MLSAFNFPIRPIAPKKSIQSYPHISSERKTKEELSNTERAKSTTSPQLLLNNKRKRSGGMLTDQGNAPRSTFKLNSMRTCQKCSSMNFSSEMVSFISDGLITFSCKECFNQSKPINDKAADSKVLSSMTHTINGYCSIKSQGNRPSSSSSDLLISIPLAKSEGADTVAYCENYYCDKSHSKSFYKKRCLNCQMKQFHVNELLYFDSIQRFFKYLKSILIEKIEIVYYNKGVVEDNKRRIKEYYDSDVKSNRFEGFCFSQPKTLCKGCLLAIINQHDCISVLKRVLNDNNDNDKGKNDEADFQLRPLPNEKAIPPHYQTDQNKSLSEKAGNKRNAPLQNNDLINTNSNAKSAYIPQSLFNKLSELNFELITSIEKVTQGAMLFNDHYQLSPIEKEDFEIYFSKINKLHEINKETIINLIKTTLQYKDNLFSFLAFSYKVFSLFSDQCHSLSTVISGIITQIEQEFNEYNASLIDSSQALMTFQNLTTEYLLNLKEQGRLLAFNP